MTEQWINELRAEPVDTDPRPGFKDELRETILAERNGSATTSAQTSGSHRLRWLLGAAAAACVALLIGGLLALSGNDPALTPATVPKPTTVTSPEAAPTTDSEAASTTVPAQTAPVTTVAPDLVVTDPQTISLDQWIDPAKVPSIGADIVAIDREALPAGWAVSDEDGRLLVYPNQAGGYLYTAAVTTDDQAVFDVSFSRDDANDNPCFLPVGVFPGTVGDLTGATVGDAVCGLTDDGSNLAVVPADVSGTESQWTALDVANTLSFVESDTVPHPDLTVTADQDEPAEVDLAGTLSGARWAVTGERSSTRRIDLYIAGNLVSGADVFAPSSLQSQPVFGSTITGVPGYGAVVYGDVEGDGVSVIVALDDGRTARLRTSPFYERSNFAVPIPDSVDVATVTFIAADGSVLAVADLPEIPLGYGGGFLGLIPRR